MLPIISTGAKLKSVVLNDFWKEEYDSVVLEILNDLIEHPSQYPVRSNKGIALSIDGPYNKNERENPSRPSVMRQYFSIGHEEGKRYAYGAGKTVGTDQR